MRKNLLFLTKFYKGVFICALHKIKASLTTGMAYECPCGLILLRIN